MGGFNIQFHATRGELARLVQEWMGSASIFVTAVTFPPYQAVPVGATQVSAAVEDPRTCEILITERPAKLGAASMLEFAERNPNPLFLHLPGLGPRGLEESRVGAVVSTPQWRALAKDVRRMTKAGAVGVHEVSGAKATYRAHRFSAGAKALFDAGVPMRQFSQSPVLFQFEVVQGQPH